MTGQPREISGRELLADIRAGIDDFGLMAKYEVTKRQLKALLKQLEDAGVLSALQKLALELCARDFVSDIRAGLDLSNLREKYAVTTEELGAVCEMFSRIGLLDSIAWEATLLSVSEPVPEIYEPDTGVVSGEVIEEPEVIAAQVEVFHYFPNSFLVQLHRSPQEVRRRLEEGMNPNARDRHLRRPALIWAAGYGNIEAVSLLVETGAEINATGKDARTALHFATCKNHEAVRELLLSRGATC